MVSCKSSDSTVHTADPNAIKLSQGNKQFLTKRQQGSEKQSSLMFTIQYKRLILILLAVAALLSMANYGHRQHHHEIESSMIDATNATMTADGVAYTDDTTNGGEDGNDELFCAIMKSTTGAYIDLSQLSSTPNKLRKGQRSRNRKKESGKTRWLVKGWGYETNFTLGICSSPVTDKEENVLSNVTGGYYVDPKSEELVSIGQFKTTPKYTGKKITLAYENGDMCPNGVDKKSTLLNFICDKDIPTKAQISFIGSLHDCSYFFEVRSIHACPASLKSNDINVLGIFFGIFFVFFAVEYGRRWFYKKLRVHLRPNSVGISEDTRPRWESVESEPRWKTALKGIFRGTASAGKNGAIKLTSTSNGFGRSNDTLVRDMEAQNELLDSLEVNSVDS